LGIVPPGTFWRNPETIKLLGLNADQQKQMDSIFHDSRVQLIQLHAALDEEQLNLEPLLNATPFDQGKAFAEISKIADLRANLEKADAKMLLGLRGVLTADQWTKFQTSIRSHQPGQEGGHSRRSHEGPGGPTDPTGPRGGGSNQTPPPPPSGDENFVEQPQ
jgi:Spy/CpxP family protein refolding chaperone